MKLNKSFFRNLRALIPPKNWKDLIPWVITAPLFEESNTPFVKEVLLVFVPFVICIGGLITYFVGSLPNDASAVWVLLLLVLVGAVLAIPARFVMKVVWDFFDEEVRDKKQQLSEWYERLPETAEKAKRKNDE